MEPEKQITCLCIVANRKLKVEILTALQDFGVNLTSIVYGKGVVKAGFLQDILGLVPEQNKVVLYSMTTKTKADMVLDSLIEKFHFDMPNTGIAFTIPIEAVAY